MIEQYIGIEDRADVLFTILNESVEKNNLSIITKVAMKALQSPVEDSLELVEKFYDKIDHINNPSIRLTLYKVMIEYSRAHGIMPYLAKGMLQSYLIGVMYYKFSVHAYNLCLFKDSVDMGINALNETITETRMRANTIFAICNSYYERDDFSKLRSTYESGKGILFFKEFLTSEEQFLENYEQTKEYLEKYKEFSLPEVEDNVKGILRMEINF
ncbi:hypothetical protein [Chengkuizengella marina]|uniref:Uncharacterized protein n=1 Tax=Chengkuizengella marina TaxID=2507566 RepID=A0A6N9Q2J4_9BACL|nr:hypothetical protein [Chengkuizengella marina]NBI29040.1 hypothetical protein [Chengkuizengella marina]